MTDLTKNNTPCGLMDPGNLKAMKAWPHGWVCYHVNGKWIDCPEPSWSKRVTYRAKPAPVVEKRTLYGNPSRPFDVYWSRPCAGDTHQLTFDVVDGEPVEGSERWERLDD